MDRFSDVDIDQSTGQENLSHNSPTPIPDLSGEIFEPDMPYEPDVPSIPSDEIPNYLNKEIFDTLFSQIIIQCQINDHAAKLIEKCFTAANREGITPSFQKFKNPTLAIKKMYKVCTNCNWIKDSDSCTRCQSKTGTNSFAIFDIASQLKEIFEDRGVFDKAMFYKNHVTDLGYPDSSLISDFHRNKEGLTLTLNTDGVCVFKNRSNDNWPLTLQ